MDEQQLGELIGTVRAIKENTDKIPNLLVDSALHASRIAAMEPKVDAHETMAQRAFGVAVVTGAIAGFCSSLFRGMGSH